MEGKKQRKQYHHLFVFTVQYREVTAFDDWVVFFLSLHSLGVLEKSHADYTGCAGGTFWEHTPARS